MALREVRTIGDPILEKRSREVTQITDRTRELIDDMFETLYEQNGVGLSAVQVGVLKRIVVMDLSEDGNEQEPVVMINPVIRESDGEQSGYEGCLSVPGKTGKVTRPDHVIVDFLDEDMNSQTLEGEGIFARCVCHECDHLEGKLYVDLVEGPLRDVDAEGDDADDGTSDPDDIISGMNDTDQG
ncbi:MAG: peptide deformylase [Lachnospiraceae bacterium]|nr:peptide deformylase [Lachnospiraceae bacterium]